MLASCLTAPSAPIVVDATVPEEETATVYFDSAAFKFYPSEVNGETLAARGYALKLPAGETRIKGDMAYVYSRAETRNEVDLTFRKKDVEFAFVFEAGKTYSVKTGIWGEEGFRTIMNVPFTNTAKVLTGPPFFAGANIYAVESFNEALQPLLADARFIVYVPYQEGGKNVSF
jgi:hypothetical protein